MLTREHTSTMQVWFEFCRSKNPSFPQHYQPDGYLLPKQKNVPKETELEKQGLGEDKSISGSLLH